MGAGFVAAIEKGDGGRGRPRFQKWILLTTSTETEVTQRDGQHRTDVVREGRASDRAGVLVAKLMGASQRFIEQTLRNSRPTCEAIRFPTRAFAEQTSESASRKSLILRGRVCLIR